MAKEVIKRGGKKETFKPEKLKKSIRKACVDAKIPRAKIKRLVSKVSTPVLKFARKRKTIGYAVLHKKVLAGLKKAEPKAATSWLKFERRRRARRASRRKAKRPAKRKTAKRKSAKRRKR